MKSIVQDVRFAIRQYVRAPVFTLAALFALVLGIGANTAIFSVVYPVLFQPLPFGQPDELVAMDSSSREFSVNFSYPELLDLREQVSSFSSVSGYSVESVVLGAPDESIRLWSLAATTNLSETLHLRPLAGRALELADEKPSAPPVAVLGESLWRKNFRADARIVGNSVKVNGKLFTIVGIVPDGFRLPTMSRVPALWMPLQASSFSKFLNQRGHRFIYPVARMREHVSVSQASAEFGPIASRVYATHLFPQQRSDLRIVSLREALTSESRSVAWLLLVAVGWVLLIACANVANLLLARASTRQREFAIRQSLGASRWRFVQQLLTESLVLSVLGAAGGIVLSMWATDALKTMLGKRWEVASVHGPVLGFTLGSALFTGIAFGILPALTGSRRSRGAASHRESGSSGLYESLKEAGPRATPSRRRAYVQKALSVAQIALAFALLTGAGLTLTSLVNLRRVHPGFEAERVVTAPLPLPDWSYSLEQKHRFYRDVLTRVQALPGVITTGAADPVPFHGSLSRVGITGVGATTQKSNEYVHPNMYLVSPEYFAAMGIPILEGRTFASHERDAQGPRSIVISQKLAQALWPGRLALGQHIVLGRGSDDPSFEVVGVVGNVRHHSLEDEAPPQLYIPFEHWKWANLTLVVKMQSAPESIMTTLQKVIREADPSLPVVEPKLLRDRVFESAASWRDMMVLLGAFAALAIVLAGVGLYGLIAYVTSQRTQELAIRIALGAQPRQIVALIMRQGLWMTAVGLGLGLVLAVSLSRVMSSFVYGIGPIDVRIYAGAGLVLGAAALLASYGPARRATQVDPLGVLRSDS